MSSTIRPQPYRYPSEHEIGFIQEQHPNLICPACDASGVKGCESCGGRGLVCPTCRGGRYVKRSATGEGEYGYQVSICPECSDLGKYSLTRELAIVSVYRKRAFTSAFQQKQLGEDHGSTYFSEHESQDK